MSNLLRGAWILPLLAGCSTPGADVEAGRETGACIEDACFDGLACLSDLCVGPDADDDDGESPVSTAGSASGASTSGSADESGGSSPTSTPDPTIPDPSDGDSSSSEPGDTSGQPSDDSSSEGTPIECDPPTHEACDGTGNAFRAIGVNCPGEPQFEVTSTGSAAAVGVRNGFGETNTWDATEGSRFAVIGSGFTTDLDSEAPDTDTDLSPTHCNDDLGAEYDVGVLPTPLDETTASIAANWSANGAFDYTELRLAGDAPGGATSIAFDFAFFSAEYPGYSDSEFADMFVAWLESESWTGNLAFDDAGEAITQRSELVSLRDDMDMLPELAGTCMRGHAASPWLRTTAPLQQGEELTLAFAIFDMADSIVDSYAFVDNVTFGCEDVADPATAPVE
jgi:hypothetical protein